MNKITITGDLGSGKSAVSKLLEEETGFPIYSTGAIQREIATKHAMTTLELNRYAETHPEIDEEIDEFSRNLGRRPEGVIVDSRLAWFFIPNSFKVYLKVDLAEAVRRIMGHDRGAAESYPDEATAKRDIATRKQLENERFRELYGADCADMANFDLVLDTTDKTPQQVGSLILSGYRARGGR
jgi:cytidylate kinase